MVPADPPRAPTDAPRAPSTLRAVLVTLAHVALLAGVAVVLYGATLRQPLTSYDDLKWMDDTEVRNSLRTIFDPTLATDNPFATTYYLPLQSALFYGMVSAFDREPLAYRSLALAIHLGAAILIYLLLCRMRLGRMPALLAALFVTAHLGNVQSVTWVSASYSHALVTVLVLGTMLAFHRHLETGSRAAYGSALVVFVAAMLVRESAVIVPVLLFGMELLAPPSPGALTHRLRRDRVSPRILLKYLPFVLTAVPIVLIALRKYQGGLVKSNWGGVSLGIHAVLRLLDFLTLMLVPRTVPHGMKLALTAAVLLGGFFLLRHLARWPAAVLGLGWMVLGALPYSLSNFNPALHIMRYLYPGLMGLALILALGIAGAAARWPRVRVAIWSLAGAVPLVHAIAVWGATHR